MEALHSLEGRGETVTVGKRDAADNGMAATHPDKQGAVFISHSPNDRFYVDRLARQLSQAGIAVSLDREAPTAERWQLVLQEKVEASAALIVVMTPAAEASEWVQKEVGHARLLGRKVWPIWLAGRIFPDLKPVQVEKVAANALPSVKFVQQLAEYLASRSVMRYAYGLVPEATDCFQPRAVADEVVSAITPDGSAILTGGSAHILSGLGGVGKTQLAAQVARRMRDNGDLDALLWIAASSGPDAITAITSAYADAGVALAGAAAADPTAAARTFLEYLARTNNRWLIVVDDATDPADLQGWWPPRTPTGHVIVTTRRTDAALQSHGALIPIGVFTPAESLAYLITKLGPHQPTRPDILNGAARLADDLGHLPVAVAQAAAYIVDDRNLTCVTYRTRFADQRHRLQDLSPHGLPGDYTRPLTVTLAMSVDAADSLSPTGLARPLLVLLALLDGNGVPQSLIATQSLLNYLTIAGKSARPVDADRAGDALAALLRFNLATLTPPTPSGVTMVAVHRLVQRAIRDQAQPELLTDAVNTAAISLISVWPDVERDGQLSQALRGSTLALLDHGEDQFWQRDVHPLLLRAGRSLTDAGLVGPAVSYWQRLAERAASGLDPGHPQTLTIRENLANAYLEAGRLSEAISMSEQMVTDRERIHGRDHPDTLRSQNNLAAAYESAGRLAEAISLFEQVLTGRERVSGPDHTDTLVSRHNLAAALKAAGRLAEAIAQFERVLADSERVLGRDHRRTVSSRSGLADAYRQQGRVAEALTLSEQVLNDRERILGADHPDSLSARNNLAFAYQAAGRLTDAIELFEQTSADSERVLGPGHPKTLVSWNNLADAYRSAGQAAEAVTILERVVAEQERILDPEDPSVMIPQGNLASAYVDVGRVAEAIALFERVLCDGERILGSDHPDTLVTLSNLAFAYKRSGRLADAIIRYGQAVAAAERLLGRDHPMTEQIRTNLATAKAITPRADESMSSASLLPRPDRRSNSPLPDAEPSSLADTTIPALETPSPPSTALTRSSQPARISLTSLSPAPGRDGVGHVFISYARADGEYVDRLVAQLTEAGVSVWLDRQIPTAERWEQVLREKVETCSALIAVMTPVAGESRWVAMEVGHARVHGRRIWPLRLSGSVLFGLDPSQCEDARSGALPSADFIGRLTAYLASRRILRYQHGIIPATADTFQLRMVGDYLESALSFDEPVNSGGESTQILSGLVGIGKTQLAAHAARRMRDNRELDVLVWINAATGPSAIITALAVSGAALVGADPADPTAAARHFLDHLANTDEHWLVVIDDLPDPADLDGWWPPHTSTGRVIVTTRRTDATLASYGALSPIEPFTPDDARSYLAAKLGPYEPTRPDIFNEADQLAHDLGHLPLALAQAAAYIVDQNLTCAAYRARFADQRRRLHDLAPEVPPDDTQSLTVTVALSIDAADALPPAGLALPLLRVLALLDPDGIPQPLITSKPVMGYLGIEADQQMDAEAALAALVRLNLATLIPPTPDGVGLVRMHALMQRVTRDGTAPDLLASATTAAAQALVTIWPETERDTQLGHALRANTMAMRRYGDDHLWQPDAHPLLFRAGRSLIEAGLLTPAISYWNNLITQSATRLGRDHRDTLASAANLAQAYLRAGQLPVAITLLRHVLTKREGLLGPDHLTTVLSRSGLARAVEEAGQLTEAIALYQQVLTDRERLLGPTHPDTLITRNDLAHAYQSAGRLTEAITLLRQVITESERVLGPDHQDILVARNNLARAYQNTGRVAEAITLHERVVADSQRILGPDHPDALASRQSLAHAYQAAGRLAEAIEMNEQLRAESLRVLGPEHPHTLVSVGNLAYTYYQTGRLVEAIDLYAQVLADRERILGPGHPHTLGSRGDLAVALMSVGRVAEAITLHEQAVAGHDHVLGPDHPDAIISRNNLASAYEKAGRITEAIELYQQALSTAERVLGADHPTTRGIQENLRHAELKLRNTTTNSMAAK
jgi:tetratricopeptide (TPR) repeat protein